MYPHIAAIFLTVFLEERYFPYFQGWVRVCDHEYEYFVTWKLDGEYESCEKFDDEYEYKYCE